MSPVALAALRCGIAALVLGLVTAVTGSLAPAPTRAEWRRLILLGLTGNTIFQLCLIGGVRLTSPAHSALIVRLSPIFTALLARIALREPLSRGRLLRVRPALPRGNRPVTPGVG